MPRREYGHDHHDEDERTSLLVQQRDDSRVREEGEERRSWRKLEVLVCWLVAWFATFNFTVVLPGLRPYLDDIHTEKADLVYGIITGVCPLATAFGALLIPQIVSRWQPRLGPFMALLVAFSLPMFAYGFVRNPWAILVLRTLGGFTASTAVFCRKALAQGSPQAITFNMTGFTVCMGIGYASGPAVGAALATVHGIHDYILVGIVCGSGALLLCILSLIIFFRTPTAHQQPQQPQHQRQGGPPTTTPVESSTPLLPTRTPFSRQLIYLYLINALITIVFTAFVAAAAPRIGDIFDWHDTKAGYVQAVIGAAFALSGLTNGILLEHVPFHANFAIAFACSAGGSALLADWTAGGSPNLPRVIVGCLLSGFGNSLTGTMVMKRIGMVTRNNPNMKTRAFSWLTITVGLASIFASVWTGVMLHYHVGVDLYYANLGLVAVSTLASVAVDKHPVDL